MHSVEYALERSVFGESIAAYDGFYELSYLHWIRVEIGGGFSVERVEKSLERIVGKLTPVKREEVIVEQVDRNAPQIAIGG